MDKLIQFIRYVFYYHLLHLFLGGLSVILILIITDEMANTPMLVLVSIFLIGAFLSSRNTSVYFLNDTLEIDNEIIELFKSSNNYLYIISPYFNAGDNRLNSIIDAKKRGCDVTVLINSKALINKNTIEELSTLQKLDCNVLTHPNLHSKIYLNEKSVITGSVNLVKGSFEQSLEMGIHTEDIYEHKKILEMINRDYLGSPNCEGFNIDNISKGYCIRSKARIIYNVKSPMERSTYLSSSDRMTGRYCHKCGKESDTTISEPLCDEHK